MKEEIDFDKVYNKIQHLINKGDATISVLEDQIDVELQLDYFNFSKQTINKLNKEEVLDEVYLLNESGVDLEKKKEILSSLAKIDNPEAYRAIESYKDVVGEELKQWTTLALQESKMVLETSLLGKAPIFISTGLGGKGDKLRYFLVLVNKENEGFATWQKDLVNKELQFDLKHNEGELEEVKFLDDKVIVCFLIPISVNVKEIINQIISNCNEFGDFLLKSFIVTNVKKLSDIEIQDMVDEYREDIDDATVGFFTDEEDDEEWNDEL